MDLNAIKLSALIRAVLALRPGASRNRCPYPSLDSLEIYVSWLVRLDYIVTL